MALRSANKAHNIAVLQNIRLAKSHTIASVYSIEKALAKFGMYSQGQPPQCGPLRDQQCVRQDVPGMVGEVLWVLNRKDYYHIEQAEKRSVYAFLDPSSSESG